MGWAVVKFLDEDAVEAVPHSWYIDASEECFWPPVNYKRDKIVKLIEQSSSPLSDWKVYSALLLGSYDDFAVAQRKAKKALITTDLSSNSDIYKGRGSRTRKKNPRYMSHSSSDSDESQSLNRNTYPVLKPTPQTNCSTSPEIQEESIAESMRSEGISHENKGSKNDMARYGVNREPTSCDRRVTSKPLSHRVSSKSNFGDKSSQQIDALNDDQDFKRLMVDEMTQINFKINTLIESVSTLLKRQRIETDLQLTSYENKVKVLYEKIPVKNETELEEFESYLADNENFKVMILELSRIGGSNMGQSVRKILYRLLTDEVALLFSWDGARLKRPFKSLRLAKCILESMKVQFIESKEQDITAVIKSWLVKSKERITYAHKKAEK